MGKPLASSRRINWAFEGAELGGYVGWRGKITSWGEFAVSRMCFVIERSAPHYDAVSAGSRRKQIKRFDQHALRHDRVEGVRNEITWAFLRR